MRIAIAADESARTTKEWLASNLIDQGHEVVDVTPRSAIGNSLQYSEEVAFAVFRQDADRGIVVTSRSVGASLAANRVPGIRAALCGDIKSAEIGAAEDGMNVLVLADRQNAIDEVVRGYLKASVAPVHVNQGLSPRGLRLLFSYINDNISASLKVAELANLLGISQFYFSKLFKVSTGLTPHHYVMRRRVEHAQAYLRDTELELREIATRTGFETQSHFTSVFHRLAGATPKRHRDVSRLIAAAEPEKVAETHKAVDAA